MNMTPLNDAVTYFDDFINYKFPYMDIPSISIAVRHDDELVYARAFGKSDVENDKSAKIDTPYRVASNSKMFTSVALMQLKDAGRIRLDDTAVTYLPWLKEHTDSRWSTVTIRHLLSHMAGAARDSSRAGFWSLQYEFPDGDELRKLVLADDLVYDPDTQVKYSNYGYGLLGQVIEAVTGSGYRTYITDTILKPLSLHHTWPDLPESIIDTIAVGYTDKTTDGRRIPIDTIDTRALSSATGCVSTPSDLTHFMTNVFNGTTALISSQSVSEVRRIHGEIKYGKGSTQYYGLGFEIGDIFGEKCISHGGGFPGQITKSLYIPSKKLALSVVMNGRGHAPMDILKSFMSVLNWFTDSYVEHPKHDLRAFTSRYSHLWGATDVIGYGDSVVSIPAILPIDLYNAEVLERIDANTLKVINTNSFLAPGELVTFNRNDNGAITTIDDRGTICQLTSEHNNRLKSTKLLALPDKSNTSD